MGESSLFSLSFVYFAKLGVKIGEKLFGRLGIAAYQKVVRATLTHIFEQF